MKTATEHNTSMSHYTICTQPPVFWDGDACATIKVINYFFIFPRDYFFFFRTKVVFCPCVSFFFCFSSTARFLHFHSFFFFTRFIFYEQICVVSEMLPMLQALMYSNISRWRFHAITLLLFPLLHIVGKLSVALQPEIKDKRDAVNVDINDATHTR